MSRQEEKANVQPGTMNQVSPEQLRKKLVKLIKNKLPAMVTGAPGVGKTWIGTEAAQAAKCKLLLFHPVVSDPTDYKGLPGIVEGKAEFLPYGELRKLLQAKEPTVAFLDDVGQAPAVVQAALMQLLLAREINGKKISDEVTFIAATNRRQDKAGVTSILEPVKSRFHAIYELVTTVNDWVKWALDQDMPIELIGFVNFLKTVHDDAPTQDICNHMCPRTLAHVGDLLKIGLDEDCDVAAAMGDGRAVEFMAFRKYYADLPDINALIADPENTDVPEAPEALYAVSSALVRSITPNNADRIFQYACRMPEDFSTLLVRDSVRKDKAITKTKGYIDWCVKHREVLM